ncbi:MAG: hypothetical protein KAH20_16695 [Methylococcales bacterium]|nr:hypothetical protein [Methylococcales bacterium]
MKLHFSHLVIITVLPISTQEVTAVETIKQTTHFQKVAKTAKERLGKKYADNQRINNCKVPIEKRGSKPRPDQCHRVKN